MKSHEMVRKAYKRKPAKLVAAEMKVTVNQAQKWARSPLTSGFPNPLDRAVLFIRSLGGVELLQWLCAQFGGYFVMNPKVESSGPAELLPATGGVLQSMGLLQVTLAAAVKDCRVTPSEAAAMRERWEELKSAMEAYAQLCEQRDFQHTSLPNGVPRAHVLAL